MPTVVEVKGIGEVEFPDGMTQQQIAQALQGLNQRPQQKPITSLPSFTGEAPPINPLASMMLTPSVLGQSAKGLGEAGLTLGSGLVATPVAGLKGIGAALLPGGKTGAEAVEDTASALTYQPRTEAGQIASGAVALLPELLGKGTTAAGGFVSDATGSPALGTAIKTFGDIAPALLLRGSPAETLPRTLPKKPPTSTELRAQAGQAYQAAEDAGVIVRGDSLGKAVENIINKVADEGIDATLHPNSMAALNRLMDAAGNNHSLKGVEILRRVIQSAEKSIHPDDARIARIMRRELDDYVEGLGTKDVLSGDTKSATAALKEARDLYSRNRKAETIEGLINRAQTRASQFSGSGYENALRTEFRQLAMNEKKMRRFTKDEQAAIKKVAEGGPIGNILRMLGKAAPTGIVSGVLSGTAGAALFGPLGAAALPLAGGIARKGATALTARNARLAAELMRRGGSLPRPSLPAPGVAIADLLANPER